LLPPIPYVNSNEQVVDHKEQKVVHLREPRVQTYDADAVSLFGIKKIKEFAFLSSTVLAVPDEHNSGSSLGNGVQDRGFRYGL
jgi:hypothetical protein